MDAVELFFASGKGARVWMCGKCHRLHNRHYQPLGDGKGRDYTPEERDEFGRLDAVRCCDYRCEACSEKCRDYYSLCDKHWAEASNARERETEVIRFEKAKKLTLDEWGASDVADNYLYHSIADRWFRDLDDLEEWLDDDGRERPAYLWCTTEVSWQPDVSGYIADQVHDHFHEDACDQIDDAEYKRLDEVVSEWWNENKPTSYEPDFGRCVLLQPVNHTESPEPPEPHPLELARLADDGGKVDE